MLHNSCSRDAMEKSLKCVSTVKFIAAFDLRQCNKYICADVETLPIDLPPTYSATREPLWRKV